MREVIRRAMPEAVRLPLLFSVLVVSACAMSGSGESRPGAPPAGGAAAGSAQPPAPSGPTPAPPPRQFRLGPATSALVAQAHQQENGSDYGQAAATLERAVRIEPDNPLVWIELGRVRLGESNAAQADALGHKALTLATGDPAAQASAWHLIADAARARGRNAQAYDAERKAEGLSTR
jgi:tetratricopeptide (TPR) repeat protein